MSKPPHEPDSNLPSDEQIVKYFGRHFVQLYCTESPIIGKSKQPPGAFAASGFVISVHGEWFWISAGHVIHEINERMETRRMTTCRFVDTWGENRVSRVTIPVEYSEIQKGVIDGFDGLDCVAVPLPDLYVQLLLANGIVPIDEEAWRKVGDISKFEGGLLMGLPFELASHTLNEGIIESLQTLVLIGIRFVAQPPSEEGEKKIFPRIFAAIPSKEPSSIKGMSGGPVLGLRRTPDGLRYWIVGIQSGWYESERIISVSPLKFIGEFLESYQKERDGRSGIGSATTDR